MCKKQSYLNGKGMDDKKGDSKYFYNSQQNPFNKKYASLFSESKV